MAASAPADAYVKHGVREWPEGTYENSFEKSGPYKEQKKRKQNRMVSRWS